MSPSWLARRQEAHVDAGEKQHQARPGIDQADARSGPGRLGLKAAGEQLEDQEEAGDGQLGPGATSPA